MNQEYFRKENEKELDYAMRLISTKKEKKADDLDWSDIVNLLGLDLNKDSLRKSQDTEFGGIAVYNKLKKEFIENEPKEYQREIEVQLQELKKERMKLSDERAALNRKLRKEARKETIEEIALKCAKEIPTKVDIDLNKAKINSSGEKVALLTLSDFHYGLDINEFNNVYNPEVFKKRFGLLLLKTLDYIKINEVGEIYVLGLGDYLSGIIHTTTRIENRENIVSQVMEISEYLFNFLKILSEVCTVYYKDVTDNHGRVFPNKEENQNLDNFSIFIKWYLKAKISECKNINILENEFNNEIGTVEILGNSYAFVHGHRDRIGDIVQNLSLMTKKFYTAIFIAHSHHFEANEIHGTYVYMNGTLSGTDCYANNSRKTSNPSQNLFILNKDGIECHYLIRL